MKLFRVVADSSCLIGLAQIGQFGLLKELFAEICIPRAVYEEVVVKGRGEAGSGETETAVKDSWMSMKAVDDETPVNALRTTLGKGESEVIVLCKALGFDYALIDERAARYIYSRVYEREHHGGTRHCGFRNRNGIPLR